MKLRLLLTLLLSSFFLLNPTTISAIVPFAPYSVEGNPTDEYQLVSFFPLLRFISPEKLIVYENQDQNRTYAKKCGETRPKSCQSSSACRATINFCDGTQQEVAGTCTGLDTNNSSSTGTCQYPPKNPTIYINPSATDFSHDSSTANSAPLALPKFQNESLRYENPGGGNTITWGSHFLTLDRCERASRQLMVAYQAYETKTTSQSGEWPLGWVDYNYITRYQDKTLLQVWEMLSGAGLESIASDLVDAQNQFFLALGQDTPPRLPNLGKSQTELCSRLNSTSPQEPWAQALELLPLYPPSFRQSYVRTSICVWGLCKPGPDSSAGQGLYADISIHPAYAAAIFDLLKNTNSATYLQTLNDLAKINPLIRYSLNSTPAATPTQLTKSLDPLSSLKPFTFSSLGYVYDYQNQMDKYGYVLAPIQSQEEGGAFPTSLTAQVINFAYGVVDALAPVSTHIISIPEPLSQLLNSIQEPINLSYDTAAEQQNNNVYSNIANADSLYLLGSKGMAVGSARRRLGNYACSMPDSYSAPVQTESIKAVAQNQLVGCTPITNVAPPGTCDGKLFGQIVEGSPYMSPLAKASSAFQSISSQLTQELIDVYAEAEKQTGVPCEVLAGIHYVEADLNPQGSLVSGRPLGQPEPDAGGRTFKTLLETAVYAGNHLKGKVGNIKDVNTLITALSRYNGGGNSNCQAGYPYPIPYSGCPRQFEGEDDPYPVNWIDDRHSTMYLLYCADLTACEPAVWERMGALTFAVEMYGNVTKAGATP